VRAAQKGKLKPTCLFRNFEFYSDTASGQNWAPRKKKNFLLTFVTPLNTKRADFVNGIPLPAACLPACRKISAAPVYEKNVVWQIFVKKSRAPRKEINN